MGVTIVFNALNALATVSTFGFRIKKLIAMLAQLSNWGKITHIYLSHLEV